MASLSSPPKRRPPHTGSRGGDAAWPPGVRPSPVLVIGCGNALRGDDAAGQRVADAIERLHLAGVRTLAAAQLTPEMAADLAGADLAIFVDARVGDSSRTVQVKRLSPTAMHTSLGHTGDPEGLLHLAQVAYGRCPEARLVTIPGTNLDIGDDLSSSAAIGITVAVKKIHALIRARTPAADTCIP